MYVETSAIVAILIEEPEGPALLARLERSTSPFTSVVTKVEAALALGKAMGDFARSAALVDAFLAKLNVRIEAVLPDHYPEIMQAAVRYGKGSGHPAELNFGDCFSYASAKRRGSPLVYKGNDFAQTDLAG